MLNLFRRIESRALILVIAAAGALWTFFNLASEVGEGDTATLDRRILLALRNPPTSAIPSARVPLRKRCAT